MIENKLGIDPRETKRFNDYEEMKNKTDQNLSIDDLIVADNIAVEFYRGVSLKDLATKYQYSIDKVKAILENAGIKVGEGKNNEKPEDNPPIRNNFSWTAK